MFEVPFLVEAAALGSSSSSEPTATNCLAAFDAARGSIYDVAREVYSHGRQTRYVLTSGDFR
jgi:hypothetical protein